MRILILRHGYYPSDPRVRREATALVGRGHRVEVICLRRQGEAAREVVNGVAITRMPLGHRRRGVARYLAEYGAFFFAATILTTCRQLRRRYDLVQVNTMPDGLVFAALAARLTGTPVLLDLHELMPELFATKYGVGLRHPVPRLLAWQEQLAIRFADACLAVSGQCLDRFAARGAPRGKFTVVMNTADPELFNVAERPTRPARDPDESTVSERTQRSTADPNLSTVAEQPLHPVHDGDQSTIAEQPPRPAGGPPTIISHGTLVARYGFDLVIRALAEVPSVRLEIVGEGEARPALERLASDLGVTDRVTFAGFVPLEAIANRIARADVGVVANRRDAFTDLVVPTKLLEYVALGVPAAVARTAAVEAYFDEHMVAYFPPGNAAELARTLRALLGDPARRRALAARAAERYERDLRWPVMAERYLALVERLGSIPTADG